MNYLDYTYGFELINEKKYDTFNKKLDSFLLGKDVLGLTNIIDELIYDLENFELKKDINYKLISQRYINSLDFDSIIILTQSERLKYLREIKNNFIVSKNFEIIDDIFLNYCFRYYCLSFKTLWFIPDEFFVKHSLIKELLSDLDDYLEETFYNSNDSTSAEIIIGKYRFDGSNGLGLIRLNEELSKKICYCVSQMLLDYEINSSDEIRVVLVYRP